MVAGLLLGMLAGPALAQLTREDIAALREQGKAEGWTFTVDLNGASKYSLDELCGAVKPIGWEDDTPGGTVFSRGGLPDAWDWRDNNGCTSIRSQGGCGSCWAFSAVGAVESSLLINEGWNTNLSEQWLVSCTDAGSCSGGWHSSALGYLICGDTWRDYCGDCGPVLESDFPYVAWNAPCGCPYPHPYTIDNWGFVGGGTDIERIKQAIHEYGPVSATVAVGSAFQGYSEGIFNVVYNGPVNHAIVLVGWDDNQGSDGIWFLRNSWGTWWGEGGYMRIEYGCSKVGGSACYVEYRLDCNHNGIPDADEIADGTAEDCNDNGVPDECDIDSGVSTDCNTNEIPDECEMDRITKLYVDQAATGVNTGTSWEDALIDLEAAFCYTQLDIGITEVWVARGTYTPSDGDNFSRAASFRLANGVALYGGFAGTETSLDQRDLGNPANRTIMSGDLFGDDEPGFINYWDNSYHVLLGCDTDATAILDGFTITGGYADGSGCDNSGAGMYSGGGSPTIVNCVFMSNYAVLTGGGMHNTWGWSGDGSSPTLINCVFSGNSASNGIGGAVYNTGELGANTDPVFINCTFTGNTAAAVGGIYSGTHCHPTLANCVFWDNSDGYSTTENAQIYCNEVDVNYSCIQGLTGDLGGTGNIGGNPSFVDADGLDDVFGTLDDDARLNPASPCIDAADNEAVPVEIVTDLEGNPRFVDDTGMPDSGNAGGGGGAIIDMGAHEFQDSTCFGDLNGDNSIDLADLSALLANYGMMSGATYSDGDLDGNGAVDLSDLSALLSVYGTTCP